MLRAIIVSLALSATSGTAQTQNCELLCNGNFENPFVTSSVGLYTSLNCWSTTATDGNMEVWHTGFGPPSYDGVQHVELNATQAATMYQDFNVAVNQNLSVSFAHRGRAGMDSMEVSIGPAGGPYISLGRYGDNTTAWGYYTASHLTFASGPYRVRFTPVYWSGGNIAIGNFLDAVSVSAVPALSVSSTASAVCKGSPAVLSVQGAANYTWTGGSSPISNAAYTVTPQANTVYTVSSGSGNCAASQTVQVNVLPQPTIGISATKTLVCRSDKPQVLTATGGSSYQWTNGPATATMATHTITTTYTVTGSNTVGCSGSATLQVVVALCEALDENDDLRLTIFPNPASDIVTLRSTGATHLQLYDLTGKIVKSVKLSPDLPAVLDLSDLADGLYLLQAKELNVRRKILLKH